MDIKEISLQGWELFSDRANSINYYNSNKDKILKLFSAQAKMDENGLIKEKEISDKVFSYGISTPIAYDVVRVDDKLGIIFEAVKEKVSVSRKISEDFENKDVYIKRFVDFTKKIHQTKCKDTSYFPTFKSGILWGLEKAYFFNEDEKNNIKKLLDSIPEQEYCLVGDYQFSNVIMSPDKEYLIDLGSFCYGNPIFELAFLYYFTHWMIEPVILKILHLTTVQAQACWDSFIKMYYEGEEDKLEKDMPLILKLSYIAPMFQFQHMDVVDIYGQMKLHIFNDVFKTK